MEEDKRTNEKDEFGIFFFFSLFSLCRVFGKAWLLYTKYYSFHLFH